MKPVLPLALLLAATPVMAQQASTQSQALPQNQQFAKQQQPQSLGTQSQDSVVEEIVARVNNSIITRADMRRSKDAWQEDSAKARSEGGEAPKEQDLLRDLIDQQLLLQKGNELLHALAR